MSDLCDTPSPGPGWRCREGMWVSESVLRDQRCQEEGFGAITYWLVVGLVLGWMLGRVGAGWRTWMRRE